VVPWAFISYEFGAVREKTGFRASMALLRNNFFSGQGGSFLNSIDW
jgi:hypothetical protein